MALSDALPVRLKFHYPAFLANRYIAAGLIYLAVIGLAELISDRLLDSLALKLTISNAALAKGLTVGLLVGLFHVALISSQRPPYLRKTGLQPLICDFTAICVTALVVETIIQMFLSDHQMIQSEIGRQTFSIALLTAFAAPIAVWTIWSSDFQRDFSTSAFEKFRKPSVVVAVTIVSTLALISLLAVIVGVERDRAWTGQAHFAEILKRYGRQLALGERISNVAQQAADADGVDRTRLLETLKVVTDELAEQASFPLESVNKKFGKLDQQNAAVLRRLDQTAPLRWTLLEQAKVTRRSIDNGGPISPGLILASEAFVKVMESATMEFELLATSATEQASQINRLIGVLFPLLLSVIIFSVFGPIVQIFQKQYVGEQSASLDSAAILARLRTYQTALDEHFSVVVTDCEGRILEVNKKFCRLSGYSEGEVIGQTNSLLNSGHHKPEFFADMTRALLSGKTWGGEICNRAKDGTLYWVEAIIFPVANELGYIDKFVSIRTDVTAVKRQSEILNSIVNNFPGGVALISKDNLLVAHNKLYQQLLELPDGLFESAETGVEAIFRYNAERGEYGAGEPKQLVRERLERTGEHNDTVYEWVRPNGRALEIHRSPIAGGGYLTTYIDTTERKAAELALQHAHAQLSAFVKHAPVCVAMVDTDLRYVSHTQRWSREFNLPDDLVGQHHYDVFSDLPDRYKEALSRCLNGEIVSHDDDVFERQDGTQHTIRWQVRPWRFSDGRIAGIVMMSEDISERKKIEGSLWRAAHIDPLTGLANRRLFRDELLAYMGAAAKSDDGFALGIVDIDKFKEINDTLGHDSGDAVLAKLAKRLAAAVGSNNFVARLGGDEFAFLIQGAKTIDDIRATLADLFNSVAEPIDLNGSQRQCSISCGITMFPIDGKKATDLLKNADLALYCAKSRGRSRYEIFQSDMRRSLDRSIRIRREITAALENNELCLYYQPVVQTVSRANSGVEALIRWRHPQQGVLPPGAFLDAFEDPVLGAAIGVMVLETAVQQAGAWNNAGVDFGYVAINVISVDFASGDFAERLDRLMSKWGVTPQQIIIEVTEGMFLGRGAETVKLGLEQLQKLGVRIALDDFGTGYASLTHIKKFPVDCLKIDRSFVQDMETERHSLSIVKAVLQLARSLDLQVVAEGIETESQRRLLEVLGCKFIQGYLIAKPLPASEISDFVSQHTSLQRPLTNSNAVGEIGGQVDSRTSSTSPLQTHLV